MELYEELSFSNLEGLFLKFLEVKQLNYVLNKENFDHFI